MYYADVCAVRHHEFFVFALRHYFTVDFDDYKRKRIFAYFKKLAYAKIFTPGERLFVYRYQILTPPVNKISTAQLACIAATMATLGAISPLASLASLRWSPHITSFP